MALLRRGSSRISEDNFRGRLVREKAKEGLVTASLAWNDLSDLDLDAKIFLAKGGFEKIDYGNKRVAGGYLDVDMHCKDNELVDEPVENIFWRKPLAGLYSINVNLYKKRGPRDDREGVPFKALLRREDEDDLSREGIVYFNAEHGARKIEVFRFTVGDNGDITMNKMDTPLPTPPPAAPRPARASRAPRAMKVMKVKVMKVMKVSTIAKGKKGMVQVWQGKKVKTTGGLKKSDLVKGGKNGKKNRVQEKAGRGQTVQMDHSNKESSRNQRLRWLQTNQKGRFVLR